MNISLRILCTLVLTALTAVLFMLAFGSMKESYETLPRTEFLWYSVKVLAAAWLGIYAIAYNPRLVWERTKREQGDEVSTSWQLRWKHGA